MADFYREVIETPLSLPDDIKKKLNLESRGSAGRIWAHRAGGPRIATTRSGGRKTTAGLRKATTAELVAHLADGNTWWRLTAQRLLVERQDKTAVPALQKLARAADFPPGRAHALWTLDGLHALDDAAIVYGLRDPEAGVREQALRLADQRLATSASLRKAVVALAEDPSPRVRFQLAFTLGESDTPEAIAALAQVARRDGGDKWVQTAILSSASRTAPALLEALVHDPEFLQKGQTAFLTRLAALVGTQAGDAALARRAAPARRCAGKERRRPGRSAVLDGLGQGLQSSQRSLARLWDKPPPALQDTLEQTRRFFNQAVKLAGDDKRLIPARIAAIRLLGYGPFALAAAPLQELLAPQQPREIQLAAVHALAAQDHPKVAEVLLAPWGSYGPAQRREVLEVLLARTDRVQKLLGAIEQKRVLAGQLEPSRLALQRQYPNAAVRRQAEKLLVGQAAPARQKIVEDYKAGPRSQGGHGAARRFSRRPVPPVTGWRTRVSRSARTCCRPCATRRRNACWWTFSIRAAKSIRAISITW